ncbi:hypothetical protein WJX84_009877 [Apatococcus fuscideae]|uniref:AB hydrolase-1 domain-containing protein n=1 Tax=Apatococcus fuscideae TaxID=2026836 RepID=A0AAW1T8W0_9CHLO
MDATATNGEPEVQPASPVVVLLHGLLRSSSEMDYLARRIKRDLGWECHSLSYPSTSQPLEKLAEGVAEQLESIAGAERPVWAVTHSMGGIVLRHLMQLENNGGVNWAGAVMIGPPNHGSQTARSISHFPGIGFFFSCLYGQAGMELAQEVAARETPWPDPPKPYGIIAGTTSVSLRNPVSWLTSTFCMLPGPGDGTVRLEETMLPTMTDFATIDCTHTLLPQDPRTATLVIDFLQQASFSMSAPA